MYGGKLLQMLGLRELDRQRTGAADWLSVGHASTCQAGWLAGQQPAPPPTPPLTVLACVECALHPCERLLSRHPVQLRQQAGAHGAGAPAPAPAARRQAEAKQAAKKAAATSQGQGLRMAVRWHEAFAAVGALSASSAHTALYRCASCEADGTL